MRQLPPLDEAKLHLDNARTFLSEKADKQEGYYQNRKYVKIAGHAAYTGILLALDALLDDGTSNKKKKSRKSVDWYKEELAKLDRKALDRFVAAYNTLHLSMGYDGNNDPKVSATGLDGAQTLLDWIATRLQTKSVA